MAHGRDKHRSRRNKKIVRKLFNEQWDPIGGCPEDEYDTYVAKAYVMMMYDNASQAEIADYLWWVETEYMGMPSHPERRMKCFEIAKKLIEMKPQLEVANDI